MFLKQYAYKPRSNSQSSTGSQGSTGVQQPAAETPPKETTTNTTTTAGTTGNISAAAAGRRRSSAASGEKFAGLAAHKRNSQDASVDARKASWAEQKPGQGGILGGMWNSFTKGT